MRLSSHLRDMLAERHISEEWVWQTINSPNKTWRGSDGNFHYAKHFPEQHQRVLHVIIDDAKEPPVVVTAFFDRRMKMS